MTARTIFIIYFAFISGGIPSFLIFIVILYTLTSEYFSRELRRAVPGADPGGLMWIISPPFVARNVGHRQTNIQCFTFFMRFCSTTLPLMQSHSH